MGSVGAILMISIIKRNIFEMKICVQNLRGENKFLMSIGA